MRSISSGATQIDDTHDRLTSVRADKHAGRAIGRVLDRILDQIRQHALDLMPVHPHDERRLRERHLDTIGGSAEAAQRIHDETVRLPDLRRGRGYPRLQTREVEQVRDQAIQPLRLTEDACEQLVAIRVSKREVPA